MCYSDDIDNSVPRNKPDIITFYNMTKCGIDVDQKCTLHNVARSRRWPLTTFYVLMNIGGVNGHIIYEINNNTKIKKEIFLKHLAFELVDEQLKRRL